MANSTNVTASNTLEKAFESGFSNASQSFSLLTKTKVVYTTIHQGFLDFNNPLLSENYQRFNNTPGILLTTEVFGDVTGKSYLFLSEKDYELLTKTIPESALNLKDEFAKEVDNILSAAVITKLSNSLNKKMFGDVPVLVGKVNSRLEDTIYDDFGEQVDGVYINSIFFSFENHSDITPFFVWVFEKSLIEAPQEIAVL
jgi:chemotaxis protein CheY-P-specific phosphatase CheC